MRKHLAIILIATLIFCVITEKSAAQWGGEGAFGSIINYLKRVGTNVIPSADSTYDLGSTLKRWKDAYIDRTFIGDIATEDATPSVGFKDTDSNVGYIFHLESGAGGSPYNNFTLWRGTYSGSTFSVNPDVPLVYWDNSNNIHFYGSVSIGNNKYTLPNSTPADNQIFKWDAGTGALGWEADATGGAGGFSVYLEEGDVAKLNNSAADMTLDFDATDFETAVVGTELNLTIPDDGHLHTGVSLSSIDISADTNLTAGDFITLTDDDLDVDTAAVTNGDTTHLSSADAIYDFCETTQAYYNSGDAIAVVEITLDTAGVNFDTDGDGALTISGLGDGFDEDITLNFDDVENTIGVSSSSGVTYFNFGAMGLNLNDNVNLRWGGDETLTFDAITSADFELSDDLNINDTDPHVRLVDSNGDDFELWADADRVYLANVTDSIQLLEFDENYRCFLYEASTEVAGLVRMNMLKHFTATFDPSAWYDQDATNHNVPLFTVGDDMPQGIIIDEWQCTYSTGNPTTELDANLYFADSWAWANETLIDAIDTTAGSSTEDTDANINSGNAVTNGKKVYIGFDADPTDASVVVIFELWYHLAN